MSGAHAAPSSPRRALSIDPEGTVVTLRLGTLGREPALALMGVVGPLTALLISLAPGLSPTWQIAIGSLIYAAAGVVVGLLVAGERLAPAIVGLAQALLNIALAAGTPLTEDQQAALMTAVGLLAAAFVRTQVTAALPPVDPFAEPESDDFTPEPEPEPPPTTPFPSQSTSLPPTSLPPPLPDEPSYTYVPHV